MKTNDKISNLSTTIASFWAASIATRISSNLIKMLFTFWKIIVKTSLKNDDLVKLQVENQNEY